MSIPFPADFLRDAAESGFVYTSRYLTALRRAMANGADIRGYFQ